MALSEETIKTSIKTMLEENIKKTPSDTIEDAIKVELENSAAELAKVIINAIKSITITIPEEVISVSETTMEPPGQTGQPNMDPTVLKNTEEIVLTGAVT